MSDGSGKWKNALLKTSLPLEYLVANILSEQGYFVWGEFSYSRSNEQGINTEFSVDLRANDLLEKRKDQPWADLTLLVECKYNYPGVRWVFAPLAKSSLIITGVVNVFEDLCTRRITDKDAIYSVDNDLPFCVKGIELHSSDANPQSIEHGLHQLRWALPQLASEIFRTQATTNHDEDLHIGFICPILVTTASLHVFREGLNLEAFQNASDLEEVAEQVDALVVYRERGPQLNKYIRETIAELHSQTPNVKSRLTQLSRSTATDRIPQAWHFEQSIDALSTRILVVTLDAFEKLIVNIRDAVSEAGRTLKRRATLKPNTRGTSATVELKGRS